LLTALFFFDRNTRCSSNVVGEGEFRHGRLLSDLGELGLCSNKVGEQIATIRATKLIVALDWEFGCSRARY
jgi:hypothetical protein